MNRCVLFDVDHTITRCSTGRRLVQFGMRDGLFRVWDILKVPVLYLRYRIGAIEIEDILSVMRRIKGKTSDELTAMADNCFRHYVATDIMKNAREAVARHVSDGDTVVLATSTLDIAVKPVAAELCIEHVVATALEYRDGLATGRVEGQPCFGPHKLQKAQALIRELGGRLDQAVFYSDSHLDLPLLEAVGEPVAVNPDRKLRRIARDRGWRVEHFT